MQNAEPFTMLIRHMRLLGYALAVLCTAWVTVVGLSLLVGMTPDELHNHRSPIIKEEIAQCSGPFAERYDCSEDILLSGERVDVGALAVRLGVTALLPGIAWGVWAMAMRRTLQMCAVVAARLAMERRLAERHPRFVQPA